MAGSSSQAARQAEWLQIFLDYVRKRTLATHVREDEGYKFRSVQRFQSNFDIDAPDLAGNLETAIENNNLVAGAMYFPRKMLLQYAQIMPDETRAALRDLFDETQDVGERITNAKATFENIELARSEKLGHKPANTYISLRFLSLLLGYRYPNKYNALKPAEWKVFCRFINPDFSVPNHTPAGEQYKMYFDYIEPLREYLKGRTEVAEIKNALTSGLEFNDDEYRWVTQDVIFVTARVYANRRAEEPERRVLETSAESVADSEEVDPEAELNTGFMAFEQHLEEYVIKNWKNINFGEKLEMYLDEDGTTGQQFTTDVGIIDILAQDDKGDFVVIELKRAESGYKVVGQILNYIGWVQEKLAKDGQNVRGLIIVGAADKTLRSALKPVADKVALKEYRVKLSLEDPTELR